MRSNRRQASESMSTKNWIRTIVAVGLITWPGVETYRYLAAKQDLEAALQRQERVAFRIAQARQAQAAKEQKAAPLMPASNPTPSPSKTPSNL